MIKTINWGEKTDVGVLTIQGTVVPGVSLAKSTMNDTGEESFSMNTGNGQTHYFKTEAKLLAALNAELEG